MTVMSVRRLLLLFDNYLATAVTIAYIAAVEAAGSAVALAAVSTRVPPENTAAAVAAGSAAAASAAVEAVAADYEAEVAHSAA